MEDGSMDGNRFDDWTRRLDAVRSRRTITRLLGSGALAAPLAAWGLGNAEAKNNDKNEPNKKRVCLCTEAGCTSRKVKDRAKVIRQNAPCAYAGGCTTNPCAATVPLSPLSPPSPPTAAVPISCRPVGQPCQVSNQCCEFAGLVCRNGVCDCPNAADPCGGVCCREDQFCDDDSCVPCLTSTPVLAATCTSDAQCCNGDCTTYQGFCNPDI
jgi:hypothetical protein